LTTITTYYLPLRIAIPGALEALYLKYRRHKNHCDVRDLDDDPPQTIDPVLATEVQDWLTHGLNRLPIELRSTLELAYRMGYSIERSPQ
jgi:DNA-directed RNA polymerase specialized sigma24 family protein